MCICLKVIFLVGSMEKGKHKYNVVNHHYKKIDYWFYEFTDLSLEKKIYRDKRKLRLTEIMTLLPKNAGDMNTQKMS